jgi:methylphosphotriester-DNA--protein-cysteine methyltransferase
LYVRECTGVASLRCEIPRTANVADRQLAEFIVAGVVRTLFRRAFKRRTKLTPAEYREFARASQPRAPASCERQPFPVRANQLASATG